MSTVKLSSRLSTRVALPRATAVLICECWSSEMSLFCRILSDVLPDGTLLGSRLICDCAAANPPNPTTATMATVANNLFLISALPCSPAKLSRDFLDREMPLLDLCDVLTGSACVYVLASSPEIGTKFPERFFG